MTLNLLKGHDVILDGCDNFDTKYAVDDAAELGHPRRLRRHLTRFEGQASTLQLPAGRWSFLQRFDAGGAGAGHACRPCARAAF